MSESIPFHSTRMGRRYYEHTLPQLVENLKQVAEALRETNRHLEKSNELWKQYFAQEEPC